MSRSALTRRFWCLTAILLASRISVKAVRGSQKPYAPEAPAYREKGRPDAPVVIVEFSDLQCPACRFAVTPLKDLLAFYGDKAHLTFKHYPLTQHAAAWPAAVAAECAGRQGRFWDLHDLLYDKQADWAPKAPPSTGQPAPKPQDFIPYAKSLGLDLPAFEACLQDPAISRLVERDRKDGDDHWVLSTPTFFINGRRFVGARQLTEGGIPWIDKLLKKKS